MVYSEETEIGWNNLYVRFLICVNRVEQSNQSLCFRVIVQFLINKFIKKTVEKKKKLQCYTRISGPEKSRNNKRESISYFIHVCWYSQSAAYTSLAFGATRSGW